MSSLLGVIDMITKGVGIVFDTDFEKGYRSDMEIVMVATWDGKSGEVFTDINLSERSVGCAVWTFDDEAWEESGDLLIGHNLHDKLNDNTFDLLKEIKGVSADYLQNEGKRFTLHDLARWNKCRKLPTDALSKIRRVMAWRKGQYVKVARWALEDARLCYDLYHQILKKGEVRFLDVKTGKKPSVPVRWGDSEE